MEIHLTIEDFKLIKSFYPEFARKPGIKTNNIIIGWSELMPVVEKLDLIDGYTCISIDHDQVFLHRKNGEMLDFKNEDHGGKIGAVYAAVVKGIEWIRSNEIVNEN